MTEMPLEKNMIAANESDIMEELIKFFHFFNVLYSKGKKTHSSLVGGMNCLYIGRNCR